MKKNGDYAILVEAHREIRNLKKALENKEAEIKILHSRFFALSAEAEKNYDKIIDYFSALDPCGGRGSKDKILEREHLKDIAFGIGDKK